MDIVENNVSITKNKDSIKIQHESPVLESTPELVVNQPTYMEIRYDTIKQ